MHKNQNIFNKIYTNNEWGLDSGTGSMPINIEMYVNTVVDFIIKHNIKSVLDLGSGDTKVLQQIIYKINVESYTCIEISDVAINKYYKNLNVPKENVQNFTIINADITQCEYPKCDLVLIKDVLQHLSFIDIIKIMRKIFDCCKYSIITNDKLLDKYNKNIINGQYRGIDLTKPPFRYRNLLELGSYTTILEPVVKNIMLYSKEL